MANSEPIKKSTVLGQSPCFLLTCKHDSNTPTNKTAPNKTLYPSDPLCFSTKDQRTKCPAQSQAKHANTKNLTVTHYWPPSPFMLWQLQLQSPKHYWPPRLLLYFPSSLSAIRFTWASMRSLVQPVKLYPWGHFKIPVNLFGSHLSQNIIFLLSIDLQNTPEVPVRE